MAIPDDKRQTVFALMEQGHSHRFIFAQTGVSLGSISNLRQEWRRERQRRLTRVALKPPRLLHKLGAGAVSTAPAPLAPAVPQPEATGKDLLSQERYHYDEASDTYWTFLRSAPRPVVLAGSRHRAMLRAYSNWDGQPATINEIARQFGLPRPWFEEYRRAHGWTHDREPFTAEEVLGRDLDEMVEEALQQKRLALHQRHERRRWRAVEEAAKQWWHFEETMLQPLLAAVESRPRPPVPPLVLDMPAGDYALLLSTADLHYGKRGEDGYGQEQARERLLATLAQLVAWALRFGKPERVYLQVGSDDEHIDNDLATTTRGTPQDVDGTPAEVALGFGDLLLDYVDAVCQIGVPVTVHVIPGNHNRHSAILRGQMLKAAYRHDAQVAVVLGTGSRHYFTHGDTLVGQTHGDATKIADLPSLMAVEAAREWGQAQHRILFVDHLHQQERWERGGCQIFRRPSLSGHDRYHSRHGYTTSTPAASAYLIGNTGGVRAILTAPAT